MSFTKRGIPIFSDEEKVKALAECIRTASDEDAMGHVLDLFFRLARRGPWKSGIGQRALVSLFGKLMRTYAVVVTKGSTE